MGPSHHLHMHAARRLNPIPFPVSLSTLVRMPPHHNSGLGVHGMSFASHMESISVSSVAVLIAPKGAESPGSGCVNLPNESSPQICQFLSSETQKYSKGRRVLSMFQAIADKAAYLGRS